MTSRAVSRRIDPGEYSECKKCKGRLKYVAATRLTQVIANVYKKGVWDRVEHYHSDCYLKAGEPYGSAKAGAERKGSGAAGGSGAGSVTLPTAPLVAENGT